MANTKQTRLKNKDIISASEIGQYYFCSKAWHLQKCGYKPQSAMLDVGIKKHQELGKIIDHTQKNTKKSKIFTVAGYLLLTISVLIILLEVII